MSEFTHNIEDATHFQEYKSGVIFFKWREGEFWYWNDIHECYEPVCNFEINNIRTISDLNMINTLQESIDDLVDQINMIMNNPNNITEELIE